MWFDALLLCIWLNLLHVGQHWLCFRQCHFVIKPVQFQCSKFSKVANMIYNSTSDAYSVVFAPNLVEQSLKFYKNSVQTWKNNFTFSIMVDVDRLTLLWFLVGLCSHVQMASKMVGKFKIMFFQSQIYLFFTKRGRQLLEKNASWRYYSIST